MAEIPETVDEIIARAIGASYDGCADPVETPNNWARAMSATETLREALASAGFAIVPVEPTDNVAYEHQVERDMLKARKHERAMAERRAGLKAGKE